MFQQVDNNGHYKTSTRRPEAIHHIFPIHHSIKKKWQMLID